ncbi:MAG: aldehyde dehydrogenase family protein [Lachnospiraceae bacterium]
MCTLLFPFLYCSFLLVYHIKTNSSTGTKIGGHSSIVAGIAPYNYPVFLAIDKVAYAIAMGNAFILKPASYTPVSGLVIAECFHEAGLPAGILNVLIGAGNVVGDALIEDPRINMIAFTGSSDVGCEIAKRAASHLKRYSLEMGGKNPFIVLKDADIEMAAEKAIIGAYFNAGQICMSSSRIIVEKEVYEKFCKTFQNKVKQIKTGNPHDKETMVGPLVHEKQCAVLDQHIMDAVSKGANLVCGGQHTGAFYQPSLLVDVTPEMDVFFEESFGPLTSVVCAEDETMAIDLANSGIYGLSSAVFTNDVNKALRIVEKIEAGMVHINDSTVVGSTRAPFGGVKKSGTGREGLISVEEYTEMKWITIQYSQL